AEHGRYGATMHQFHAFFEHVVQVFGDAWQLLGIRLHRDHGDFHGALPQRLTSAIDGRVSTTDNRNPGAQLHLRGAHADIAKERKTVKHSLLILPFGTHAIRLGKAYGQDNGVVVFLQLIPGNVLADFDIRLDGDAEFNEAFDLAIEHVL